MRWIKHPSSFCRSAAMSDVREALGPAGYGAAWLLLERIAETWDGKNAPELCISVKEWTKTCGVSTKKLQDLLVILKNHSIILSESVNSKLCLKAPIMLELQDDWTSRARRNSGVTPEQLGSDSGIQQTRTDKEKNRDRHNGQPVRASLYPVLTRHRIPPESDRGRHIICHIEEMQPNNPGGYLESILKQKPYFDPSPCLPEDVPRNTNNRQQGVTAAGDVLRGMGLAVSPRDTH